jgi:prophage DNA circulation protein
MSANESGHEKNVAHLDVMISSAQGIGKDYDPVLGILSIESMTNLSASCKNAMLLVRNAISAYRTAVDEREKIFLNLRNIITRVSNIFKAGDVTSEAIVTASSIFRKLQGRRSKTKKTDASPVQGENAAILKYTSASQMSYDNQIGNFSQLVSFLSKQAYSTNEKDLKIESLEALLQEMIRKNAAVTDTYTALFNARAARDKIFYNDQDGLLTVARKNKAYLKGAFGTKSPYYKKVASLEFRKN